MFDHICNVSLNPPRQHSSGKMCLVFIVAVLITAGCGASLPEYEVVIGPEEISATEDLRQGFAIVETDASESEQLEPLCTALAEEFATQGENENYSAILLRTNEQGGGSLGDAVIFQDDEAKQEFDEFYERYGQMPPYTEHCYF